MIGILTYNLKHRKTYDTLCMLKAKGYKDVMVYAIPLHYKKKYVPLIEHRPSMLWDINTEELCNNLGYKYVDIKDYGEIKQVKGDIMLVCGAGILPDEFLEKYEVINAHPGYIPNCRGLDALKWAIYDGEKIGVTTHIIGKEVDAGDIIIREEVPVSKNDTFFLVAQKVYETEIYLLVKSIELLENNVKTKYISGNGFEVHKRMPNSIEKQLLDKFEDYKKRFVQE